MRIQGLQTPTRLSIVQLGNVRKPEYCSEPEACYQRKVNIKNGRPRSSGTDERDRRQEIEQRESIDGEIRALTMAKKQIMMNDLEMPQDVVNKEGFVMNGRPQSWARDLKTLVGRRFCQRKQCRLKIKNL
jgi:hypothetical protein